MEAAFFDLDKTVIAKASLMAFGRPFYREGLISRSTVMRGLWTQLIYLRLGASDQQLSRVRESVLSLTKGWEQHRVRQIVADALERVVEPITYVEALELIDRHRAAGRRIYLISASPAEIVEPLGRFLGVDESLASHACIDPDGRYTGEMDVYAYGPYKADLIRDVAGRDGVDLAASFAYSDSYTDLPMLEAVGHPVAVNPDRTLLRVARERGWDVQDFVRPVGLRDRQPAGPRRAMVVVMAGAAAVTTAAVVLRRARRPSLDQPTRSLRTAKNVRPSRAARSRSFFMGHTVSDRRVGSVVRGGVRAPGGLPRLQSGWSW
jgi:HAD superfamily hydrolase (TIGR01490 family)